MRRASLIIIAILILAALLAVGCAQPGPSASPASSAVNYRNVTQLRYIGATTGSDNYMIGAIFAQLAQSKLGMPAGVLPGGTLENPAAIDKGDGEAAYVSCLDAEAAYNGKPPFTSAIKSMRFLARHSTVSLTFAVRNNSDIKTIPDLLKGKKIAIGTGGTAAETIALAVLKDGYGITPADIQKGGGVVSRMSYADMGNGLADGTQDCVCLFTYESAIAKNHVAADTQFGLRLLGIDDSAMKKILATNAAFSAGKVIGGVYKYNPQDVPCVSLNFFQFTGRDVPDDIVYKMMSILWSPEMQKQVAEKCPSTPDYQLKWALREGYVVPIHPGAAKWYKDQGIAIPADAKVLP
jgi:uncharacterized protein